MLRQLVVNADDLGLTLGVNDGIFDTHDLGILTSASLFANAPATVDAIRRARSHPSPQPCSPNSTTRWQASSAYATSPRPHVSYAR